MKHSAEGKVYYTIPFDGQGTPNINGIVAHPTLGIWYVEIAATVHTHTPCINDGTNGVSGNSPNDQSLANSFSGYNINHYVVGCNAIGQFFPNTEGYGNIHPGPINATCIYIN